MHRRHARFVLAALVVATVPVARAVGQPALQSLGAPRVTAQVVAGTIATPVGFFGAGLLADRLARRHGASDEQVSRIAGTAAWTGAALATAAPPALIGARGPGSGSYFAALGGAVVGGLGSFGLVRLNDPTGAGRTRPCHVGCVIASVAV